MGLNPVGASDFFLGFVCNCLTAKISFTSMYCIVSNIILLPVPSVPPLPFTDDIVADTTPGDPPRDLLTADVSDTSQDEPGTEPVLENTRNGLALGEE